MNKKIKIQNRTPSSGRIKEITLDMFNIIKHGVGEVEVRWVFNAFDDSTKSVNSRIIDTFERTNVIEITQIKPIKLCKFVKDIKDFDTWWNTYREYIDPHYTKKKEERVKERHDATDLFFNCSNKFLKNKL